MITTYFKLFFGNFPNFWHYFHTNIYIRLMLLLMACFGENDSETSLLCNCCFNNLYRLVLSSGFLFHDLDESVRAFLNLMIQIHDFSLEIRNWQFYIIYLRKKKPNKVNNNERLEVKVTKKTLSVKCFEKIFCGKISITYPRRKKVTEFHPKITNQTQPKKLTFFEIFQNFWDCLEKFENFLSWSEHFLHWTLFWKTFISNIFYISFTLSPSSITPNVFITNIFTRFCCCCCTFELSKT